MEELYKNIINQLSLKGDVLYLNDKRYMLLGPSWLAELQKGLEKLMGADGTALLIEDATRRMGHRLLATYAPLIKGKSLEEKLQFILQMHTVTGWGKLELVEIQQSPPRIVLKDTMPYTKDAYDGKADSPKCYFQSGLLAIVEGLAKSEGWPPLQGTETKCAAKGDSHCEFVAEPAQGD
jgi:predicted hydrocarbon binding protein